MKKRILSILLVALMVVSILPLSALAAEDPDVVYGQYQDGAWVQDPSSNGTVQDEATGIILSKTAKKTADNTYEITLQVVTKQTTTIQPGSAATVLVIDTSSSMNYCANCGGDGEHQRDCEYHSRHNNRVKDNQRRIAAAKTAAISFLDTYKSDSTDIGRYVAIVHFARSAKTACDWVDVSTEAGYTAAKNAIDGLSADGGTNLDDGLYRANSLLNNEAVADIPLAQKNAVVLTDGAPTYYRDGGNGSSGSATINSETAKTAATLRGNATVYTVCFGAADDYTYTGKQGSSNGPKVGDFLRDSIATPATAENTYAYNADNADDLYKAFKNITKTITEGADGAGWTVTDPMGEYISVESSPENFVKGDDNTYTYVLSDPAVSEENGTKTFTYTLTYTVTLDNSAEDFNENTYYPKNKATTLTMGDKTLNFPVPGFKGTLPFVAVTYEWNNAPASAELPVGTTNAKSGDTISVDTTYTPGSEISVADGYYTFSGWTTEDVAITSGTFTMPNKNVTLYGTWTYHDSAEITITAKSNTVPYNGTEQTVSGYDVEGLPEGFKLEGISAYASGVHVDTYASEVTGTPVIKDIDGKDVTSHFAVTIEDGVLTIEKADLVITSADATKAFDALPLTCDEYTETGLAAVDTLTLTITGTITEVGETENVFTYELTNAEDYNVTTVFGTLKVLDVLDKDNHFAYIIGYPDGSVQPEGQITREEVATIFFRLLTDETREFAMTKENTFSDVSSSRWSNTAISTLANLDIVSGYPDGTFQPSQSITRAEMATIIARFAELTEGTITFNDIEGHWAEKNIILAAANGWINGYEDGSFRPQEPIKRDETMAMINRVLDRNPDHPDDLLEGMVTFTDNMNPEAWYYLDVQEATNSHYFRRNDDGTETWTVLRENRDWAELEK
ncbi:MAG: S-layer homology domain-containing protein [Oscillospiraceae bacterium]|jgi:hypothetical protein